MDYELTGLNKIHCTVIRKALDLYSRMIMGQFTYLRDVIPWKKWDRKVENTLEEVKRLVYGFGRGASYGIHQAEIDDDARVAWDMQQVIRHRLAHDRNPKNRYYQVDYDAPIKSSKREDMPLINIDSGYMTREEIISLFNEACGRCTQERRKELTEISKQLKNEKQVKRVIGLLGGNT